MVGEWLAGKVAQEQAALKQALAASQQVVLPPERKVPLAPGGTVLSFEEVRRMQEMMAKRASPLSVIKAPIKALDIVDVHGRPWRPAAPTGLATPILIGAAALLALKFLK
jgi:hypothetical protein